MILPGLIAIALPNAEADEYRSMPRWFREGKGLIPPKLDAVGQPIVDKNGKAELDYDLAIPNMLLHYFPTGCWDLG